MYICVYIGFEMNGYKPHKFIPLSRRVFLLLLILELPLVIYKEEFSVFSLSKSQDYKSMWYTKDTTSLQSIQIDDIPSSNINIEFEFHTQNVPCHLPYQPLSFWFYFTDFDILILCHWIYYICMVDVDAQFDCLLWLVLSKALPQSIV